ncbi:hypothetical protein Tco_0151296 [Tanacetum coccineum]
MTITIRDDRDWHAMSSDYFFDVIPCKSFLTIRRSSWGMICADLNMLKALVISETVPLQFCLVLVSVPDFFRANITALNSENSKALQSLTPSIDLRYSRRVLRMGVYFCGSVGDVQFLTASILAWVNNGKSPDYRLRMTKKLLPRYVSEITFKNWLYNFSFRQSSPRRCTWSNETSVGAAPGIKSIWNSTWRTGGIPGVKITLDDYVLYRDIQCRFQSVQTLPISELEVGGWGRWRYTALVKRSPSGRKNFLVVLGGMIIGEEIGDFSV